MGRVGGGFSREVEMETPHGSAAFFGGNGSYRPGAVLRDRQKRPKANIAVKINPTSFYVLFRNARQIVKFTDIEIFY